MRVLLDTSFAERGHSGTGVYVEELRRALGRLEGVELVEARQRLRVRPGRAGGGDRRSVARSALNAGLDLWWERVALPRAARAVRADVLHHPLPAFSPRAGCAQAITVHDLAYERFPESFDPVWRRIAGRAHRRAARRASVVVCPSEAAAAEAVELLGVARERVVVAHHGPGQALPVAAAAATAPSGGARDAGSPPGTAHLLYVGSDEPRKDVDGLLRAYAAYRAARPDDPLELVLAGEAARRTGAADAAAPGLRGEPAPSRERLAELLRGAVALVHPSAYEGFGLAPLEAMAAGVPVVTVPSEAATEVYGDAVLTAEPGDLAAALERIHADAGLRERLAAAGREHAARFSWRASAERHVEAYERAIAAYRGGGRRLARGRRGASGGRAA